jgi:hypothetical protein
MAKIVQYIITDDLKGDGSEENRYRRVVQLFTFSGQLVAEFDPWKNSESFFNDIPGDEPK